MEKKSLLPRNLRRKRVLFGVIAIMALTYVLGILPKRDSGAGIPLSPFFLSTGNKVRDFFGDVQGFFTAKKMLLRQLSELELLNHELTTRNAFLESKIQGIEHLERYLNERQTSGIVAAVLNQSLYVPYDTLIVDRGIQDDVEPGFNVVASGAILLGEVESVAARSAMVKLLSYPGVKTEGYVQSLSLNVVVEGIGGSNLKFNIPKNLEVKIGDRIVSTSRQGYLIGQVELIKEKELEPLKDVILRTPLNLRHLRFVELIP